MSSSNRFALVSGFLAALIGALGLAAWLTGAGELTALHSQWPSLKFDATVALVAAGVALALRSAHARLADRVATGLGWAVAGFGGAALVALALSLDSALLPQLLGVSWPGMAPAAAFGFALLGVALALPDRPRTAALREGLALVAAALALLVVLGYVMGVQTRRSVPPISSMALAAAVGHLVIAAGILAWNRGAPVMRLLLGDGPVAASARRLLPAAILVPVGLSWLWLRGEQLGFYDSEFGVSLMAIMVVALLGAAVVASSIRLQRSESRLRDNETLFRGFFDNAPVGKVMTAPGGALIRVNSALCAILGYSADELERVSWSAITHPDDVAESGEAVRALLAGEADTRTFEKRYLRKDGRPVWTRVTTRLHRDVHGAPQHFLTHVVDIEERRKAEETLRLQGAALDAAAAAVVITSRDGTIEWVNPAFTKLTGYSAEEAVGTNTRELGVSGVHDRAFFQTLWDTILAGNVWHGEMTNRRKDGSQYPEEQTITPVMNQGGEISHFIAMKRDLTAEQGLRAQLLQAQKMEAVGQLAGGVAHDFNNILTVIQSYAEMLHEEFTTDDPRANDTSEIMAAVKRAQGLTRQLLAFSRQQVLQPVVLDPIKVVVGVEKMLRRLIGEDIELELRLESQAASVRADPGQLEQVLLNLAVNARDAMPHGGRLGIATTLLTVDSEEAALHGLSGAGTFVEISVSDSGTGMTPEVRKRIFEPFFTTKAAGRGTGLGLATVFGIVKQSGGNVSVYSEPGQGSVFRIRLPVVPDETRNPGLATTAKPAAGTETVLIVEDDEAVRTVACGILVRHGYSVIAARHGAEGLARADSYGALIHLAITDVVMPRMDGPAFVAQLQQGHPNIRVLYMSGYAGDAITRRGILQSGVPFLEKPFTTAGLLQKVRDVLDGAGSRPAPADPV